MSSITTGIFFLWAASTMGPMTSGLIGETISAATPWLIRSWHPAIIWASSPFWSCRMYLYPAASMPSRVPFSICWKKPYCMSKTEKPMVFCFGFCAQPVSTSTAHAARQRTRIVSLDFLIPSSLSRAWIRRLSHGGLQRTLRHPHRPVNGTNRIVRRTIRPVRRGLLP